VICLAKGMWVSHKLPPNNSLERTPPRGGCMVGVGRRRGRCAAPLDLRE
jgi:hypothetical protein